MPEAGFAALWEFSVRESGQAEFESRYGPAGDWARLFSQAPGFIGTELLRDRADPLRYVTIDRWASIEDWRAFRARFAAEYERLDHACETLTAREAPLGEYTPADTAAR
ncbi:MAG TPA: antibiotic biosynthesis monooxygenase family protein [Steroidobacteraceae bacterium]|jgi:heme-degrading monooxygenase HmoA